MEFLDHTIPKLGNIILLNSRFSKLQHIFWYGIISTVTSTSEKKVYETMSSLISLNDPSDRASRLRCATH